MHMIVYNERTISFFVVAVVLRCILLPNLSVMVIVI